MQADGKYKSELVRELAQALLSQGLHRPENATQRLKRESFEETFLETRLRKLCEQWHEGAVSQWEFQRCSLTINAMLEEMENDPQRFSGWRQRYRTTLEKN